MAIVQNLLAFPLCQTGAEPSTSATYDQNSLLSLAEAERWSLLLTTAELTYLIVVVNFNLPELRQNLKLMPIRLWSVVEAPPTHVKGSLV